MRILVILALTMLMAGCVSTDAFTGGQKVSNTAKGAGIGAFSGAVLGVATSGSDNRAEAAVLGALAGSAIGGGVGFYMDKQEAELRRRLEGTGVRVQRDGDNIQLIMPGNITFDVARYNIQPHFYPVLDSVALVVDEFDQTSIKVAGFTDSTGSFQLNQSLSEQRADSVASYLIEHGISSERVRAQGFGPRQALASNDTETGRAHNRRVEISLLPR